MEQNHPLTETRLYSIEKAQETTEVIYLPNYSKITITLKRLLELVRERHTHLSTLHGSDNSVQNLISLDHLHSMISKDASLKEADKSVTAVNAALKQMLDYFTNGKDKTGYIYPILLNENNHVIPKIMIFAPQKEKETSIRPFRIQCFDFSKKVIDQILSTRSKNKNQNLENEDLSLIKTNKEGTEWFYPKLLSFENEINHLLRKGFAPYSYLPMNDFIYDFIEYGNKQEKLETVTPEYHLVDEKLEFDSYGEFIKTPEVISHYRIQLLNLEKFMMKFLAGLASKNNFVIFESEIEKFKNKYNFKVDNTIDVLKEREIALNELYNKFPLAHSDENFKKIADVINESLHICKRLGVLVDRLADAKEKNTAEVFLKSVQERIEQHTKEKSTLFVLDIKSLLKKSNIKNKQLHFEMEKELKKIIQANYGYYDAQSGDGKEFFYVTHPGYLSLVIFNLTKLSIENKSYQKQLDVAKAIQEKLRNIRPSAIDTELTPFQKSNMEFQIEELYREQERIKNRKELAESYNFFAGGLGFFISLFYFIILYKNDGDILYALFSIPASLMAGLLFAILFRKKPFFREEEVEKEESEPKIDSDTENTNLIVKASENFIFKPKFNSIDERIFDRSSLKDTILSNIDSIKANSPLLSKEKSNDKVLSTVEHAILMNSAIITVPNDILPKGKPSMVILNRADLKSPLTRTQIAEHFKFLSAAGQNLGYGPYYNFLYQAVERDYFKFIKGSNLSKIKSK